MNKISNPERKIKDHIKRPHELAIIASIVILLSIFCIIRVTKGFVSIYKIFYVAPVQHPKFNKSAYLQGLKIGKR